MPAGLQGGDQREVQGAWGASVLLVGSRVRGLRAPGGRAARPPTAAACWYGWTSHAAEQGERLPRDQQLVAWPRCPLRLAGRGAEPRSDAAAACDQRNNQPPSDFSLHPAPPPTQAERLSRDATLLRLATSVEGVYVPQFYQQLEG